MSRHAAWSLRPAAPADLAALTACVGRAYAAYDIAGMPDVTAGLDDDIAAGRVTVAAAGARLFGGVVADLSDGTARVVNLAVDPEVGGAGLGRALMAEAERQARAAGARRMALTTHRDLTRVIGFYQRLGYRIDQRDGARVFMSRALD